MTDGAKAEDDTNVQAEPFQVSTRGRELDPSFHSPTATHHDDETHEISRNRLPVDPGGV